MFILAILIKRLAQVVAVPRILEDSLDGTRQLLGLYTAHSGG